MGAPQRPAADRRGAAGVRGRRRARAGEGPRRPLPLCRRPRPRRAGRRRPQHGGGARAQRRPRCRRARGPRADRSHGAGHPRPRRGDPRLAAARTPTRGAARSPRGALAGLMDGPLALAGGGLALGLGVLAAILLLGGGDDDPARPARRRAPRRPRRTPASRDPQVEPPLFLAGRPNGITIAGGRVWVLSGGPGLIVPVDAGTGRPADRDRHRQGRDGRRSGLRLGLGGEVEHRRGHPHQRAER